MDEDADAAVLDAAWDAYVAAWDAADAGARRRLLERALTADAAIAYPGLRCAGYDAIGERIGRMHAEFPGVRVRPRSGVEAHHGWLRAAWRIRGADGATMLDGVDVAEAADDGRLRRVVGFHDPLPAPADPGDPESQ